jgi:hypothetical protein
MWLGRYPGRVWMLALWCSLSGANLALAILFPANFKPPNAITVGGCAYLFCVTAALPIKGRRTRGWFSHVVLIGCIGFAAALIQDAVTVLGAVIRTGGDKFLPILPGLGAPEAGKVVRSVRASCGIAFSSGSVEWLPGESFDAAMARADALMHAEKDATERDQRQREDNS